MQSSDKNDIRKRSRQLIAMSCLVVICGILYAIYLQLGGPGLPCFFHALTGLYCPGCGITHMCLYLISLDLNSAFHSNPGLFVILPLILVLTLREAYRYIRYGNRPESRIDRILWIILIIWLVLWGILRNL